MKRLGIGVLSGVLLLSLLTACRAEAPAALDFQTLLDEVTAENRERIETPDSFAGFEAWLVDDPETAALLTGEEIEKLLTHGGTVPESLTGEEAAQDVDLLFRAFRSAYGAYYYFGEAAFERAQSEVAAWLEGQERVRCGELAGKLGESLRFLQDAHVSVAGWSGDREYRWKYHVCPGEWYGRDEAGYYQKIDGKTWYLDGFSDDRVRIEPSLTPSGELVYAPVLFCQEDEVKPCTAVLKAAAGESRTRELTWTRSSPYAASSTVPDFRLLEEDGILYLSQRSFDMKYADGEIADFVASGRRAAEAELVILDLRANGGGNEEYIGRWMEQMTGQTPEPSRAFSTRFSPLQTEAWNRAGYPVPQGAPMGGFLSALQRAAVLENETPVLVLVDDACGSAGEIALNYLRSMENVLVVGSNTAGYQLCGNQMVLTLPHSNLAVAFGVSLQFNDTLENVDFRGFEPDVWCAPQTALESVLEMLLYYELAPAEAVTALREKL